MNIQTIRIAELLISNLSITKNHGLLNGDAGLCIFFNHLSRNTKRSEYGIIASTLLDKIFENLDDSIAMDFENGLAGIGWTVEYLVQNKFAEGDTDEILEEVDNRIFSFLNVNTNLSFEFTTGLTGYLFYFIKRLKGNSRKASLTKKINQDLLIYTINKIDELVTSQFHTIIKDRYFDLFWGFPVMLLALIEAHKLKLYNDKILIMIKQWVPYFEVYIPSIQIHRLYLATVLMKLVNITNEQRLKKQVRLLLYGTDFNMLLTELDPRLISTRYGLTGLIIILEQALKNIPCEFLNYLQLKSIYQEIMKQYASDINNNILGLSPNAIQLGISEGVTGVGLYSLIYHTRR